MRPSIAVAALVACVVVLVAILFPTNCCSRAAGMKTACLSNLKQMGLGFQQYAVDWDDRLPGRDVWSEGIALYVKGVPFRCPLAPPGAYGYAFDSRLNRARLSRVENPETAPLAYDSANPIRDASDPFTSLPRPARHGGNNALHADGHVRLIVVK